MCLCKLDACNFDSKMKTWAPFAYQLLLLLLFYFVFVLIIIYILKNCYHYFSQDIDIMAAHPKFFYESYLKLDSFGKTKSY
jgi:hypothetical protein